MDKPPPFPKMYDSPLNYLMTIIEFSKIVTVNF